MKNFSFDEQWLLEAVRVEDEVGCDVHAGLEFGQDLGNYIATTKSYINRQKLISLLKENLEEILSLSDIEEIADRLQKETQKTVMDKVQSQKSA